jgi:V/A-type H+-transporting ATPase subunit I
MTKILICALERDAERLTEVLGRLEVLHLTRAAQEEASLPLEPVEIEENEERCRALLARLRQLAERLEAPLGEEGGAGAEEARATTREVLAQAGAFLDRIEKEHEKLFAERERLRGQVKKAEEVIEEIEPYVTMDIPLQQIDRFSFLHFAIGTVGEERVAGMREKLVERAVVVPLGLRRTGEGPRRTVVAISDKKGRWALDTVLKDHKFEPATLPPGVEGVPAEVHRGAVARRDELHKEQEQLRARLAQVAERYGETIRAWHRRLLVEEQVLQAEANFGRTSSTVLVSGWVPAERVEAVENAVLETTARRAVIETRDGAELARKGENVPVEFRNPPWLAPFQLLINAYGCPRYRDIEPTLFAAVSFLVMFGLMFGDLGHGLMLVAAGWGVRHFSKARTTRDFGYVVAACGAVAALFGVFLQGSVFGLSLGEMGWPLTLSFEPLGGGGANVMPYLAMTIIVGITLITLGIVLNIVNRFRTGDFEHGLFDRFGVAGFIFYWGAVGLGIKWLVLGSGSHDGWLVALVLLVPLVVICFREPLFSLLTRRPKLWEGGAGIGITEGLIEGYETVAGYLANTMSFARVGAFALSHAGLCFVIYEFEKMVKAAPGGPLWVVLVLVVGHLFVVALEGFIVFIQILRLEYYEFFSKFFRAEGRRYQPFRIRARAPEPGEE